ncbi:MAG: acyl-ACP--UDP-N-acetylglucosamine O-acyltransferase [Oligoflexales bacterium]|nr:acyl-ACP--UDP-N-acetylglucosamine O-acyltransferase [Oligoflexales bacterium]
MFDFFEQLDPEKVDESVIIHPTAQVSKKAEIGKRVKIGPWSIVGPKVEIEDDVKISSSVVISGRTRVGRGTRIFPFATIGQEPQDLTYGGEDTALVIGEENQIREYVNISIGTEKGGACTDIGNQNLIMAYTHIAHDCKIGSKCIFANGIQLAGHVVVQDNVVFGGMSGGHQFCRFGEYAMIGAGAIVVQDVAPYCMVQGDRATVQGLNKVGLKRSDISEEHKKQIKQMYRILFGQNLTLEAAVNEISVDIADSIYKTKFIDFINGTKRGLCR